MWKLTVLIQLYCTQRISVLANTRQKLKLHKPSMRLSVYQRGVYYKGISIYNRLPGVTAELITKKNLFIRQLKKYLLDNPVYTLEELF